VAYLICQLNCKPSHKFQAHQHKSSRNRTHENLIMIVVQYPSCVWTVCFSSECSETSSTAAWTRDNEALKDMVQHFKSYPPEFDIYFGSAAYNEREKNVIHANFHVFVLVLSMPWSLAFFCKFPYFSSTISLFATCVSIRFGVICMQIVDRDHCIC
jgi:hypothetical protein